MWGGLGDMVKVVADGVYQATAESLNAFGLFFILLHFLFCVLFLFF